MNLDRFITRLVLRAHRLERTYRQALKANKVLTERLKAETAKAAMPPADVVTRKEKSELHESANALKSVSDTLSRVDNHRPLAIELAKSYAATLQRAAEEIEQFILQHRGFTDD